MEGLFTTYPRVGFFKINFIIYLFCVTWVIIILIAPIISPPNSIDLGDDGVVGVDPRYENNHEQINLLENPIVRTVYHSGDQMCHQKNSRTFFIFENQMPYCSRCFGIFLGFAIGAGIVTFVVMDLKWWLLVLGLVPIGLDGGLQLITSYESNNIFRLLTGSLAGIVTLLAVGLMTVEVSNIIKYHLTRSIWAKRYTKGINNNPKNDIPP